MDRIINLLQDGNYNINEISTRLGMSTKEILKILNNLEDDLIVYVNRKNKYGLIEKSKYELGTVLYIEDGDGYVLLDNGNQVSIPKKDMHNARVNDTVCIEITNKNKDDMQGRVLKIKKTNERYVGEIVLKYNNVFIYPDQNIKYQIKYLGDSTKLLGGYKVLFELDEKITEYTYSARIIEILGHKDDPNTEMVAVLKKHNVETEFSEDVLNQASKIDLTLKKSDIDYILSHGEDLRDENIFTIDGDDTKDLDDAVSIKKIGDYYNLKVSIANVSYYVKPDSLIFNDAMKRGTSIYIPGSNVPMLPRELSNGICSLNPNVDRIALTFDMLIDNEGNIVEYGIYDSIIRSRKQMTYENVNKILEEGIVPLGYEEFVEDLNLMKELHLILRKKKIDRGFIDFDLNENKVVLAPSGKVKEIVVRERKIAERLIEDFMVQTGELASKFLDDENILHVYRVHGYPSEERIMRAKKILELLNCDSDRLNNPTSKNIQLLLDSLKEKKNYLLIAREVLKCMQTAIYSTKNEGHYALCTSSICQVTSPIRRAGDLINHILIRDNIYSTGVGGLNIKKLSYLSNNCSKTERNADLCEKESKNIKICEYMANHIGEEYEGVITYVNKEQICVEIENQIEGYIDIETINDKLRYNEETLSLTSITGIRYMLGTRIGVEVSGIDYANKKVYFKEVKKVSKKVKSKKLYS